MVFCAPGDNDACPVGVILLDGIILISVLVNPWTSSILGAVKNEGLKSEYSILTELLT